MNSRVVRLDGKTWQGTATHVFTVCNVGVVPARITVRHVESEVRNAAYTLEFEPRSFELRRGRSQEVTVTVTMLHGGVQLKELLAVQAAGGMRLFALIPLRSERAVFGVPEETLAQERTASGVRIPAVLCGLKRYLYAHGGLTVKGIFRLAPDHSEVSRVRRQLNHGSFESCRDLNCVAYLIKRWYRELPKPILYGVTKARLLALATADDCLAMYGSIDPRRRELFDWLLELMCDVAAHVGVNMMDCRNIAIVAGPNLYRYGPEVKGMEALAVSQQAVKFMHHVLKSKLR